MIRFRRGKVPVVGSTSGASSDTTAPPLATIASARRACAGGTDAGMAATDDRDGRAAARSVASCAAPSIPKARSGHDRRVGGRRAPWRSGRRSPVPRPSARRVPTTATARVARHRGVPAAHGQDVRRHRDRGETCRVRRLLDRDHADPERAKPCHDAIRALRGLGDGLRDGFDGSADRGGRSRQPASRSSRSTPAGPDATASTSCAEP